MNANESRPASIERATVVSTDHIDEELRRDDAYLRDLRGLSSGSRSHCLRIAARLHEPDPRIQRYRAPDTLMDFLKVM